MVQTTCLLCTLHRCDQGYQGTECHPEAALPSTIMSDFENPSSWDSDWQEVIGGEVVKPEQGCGVVSSGSSLYFSKVWPRHRGSDRFNVRLVRRHPHLHRYKQKRFHYSSRPLLLTGHSHVPVPLGHLGNFCCIIGFSYFESRLIRS